MQLAAIFLLAVSTFAQQDGLLVSTQQGDVVGSFSAPTVRQFLGIPYATAKRWQDPILPSHREHTFNASTFGYSCPQFLDASSVEYNRLALTFNRDNETFVPESEDCLSVNVWSPAVNRKQRTAVLLWIHGGGTVMGASSLPVYEGTNLVRDNDDIAIVSFNYRLNIFGQPNAPQLLSPGKTQNFGFLDVDAAVKWVRDNIENFGGDPNRITLFGQSGGGVIIESYALSHPNDTVVKGLIQQSGNILIQETLLGPRPRINTDLWNRIASLVGCGSNATAAQFSCMQQVPTKTLEDALIKNEAVFNPVQDDITYFEDSTAQIAAGKFLNVPLLQGTNRDETDVLTVGAQLLSTSTVIPTITEIVSDLNTARIFMSSVDATASAHVQAGHRIFLYQYQAVFPNLSLQPGLRAYHGAEVPVVFGTYNNSPIAPTPNEVAFSKYIQSVWVGFARDPERGLSNLGWPLYDLSKPTYALLGSPGNETGAVFVDFAPFRAIYKNSSLMEGTLSAFQSLLFQ